MEAEFRRFKLSQFYERVSAIDGQKIVGDRGPAIGCFRSHLKALELARATGGSVHLIEDDRILSTRLKPFLASLECARLLSEFDLVFLEMWVDEPVVRRYQEALARAGTGLHALNLRGLRVGSTGSYVVSERSADRVASLLAAEVERGARVPVDNFYSQMVATGMLRAAVVVPFLTCTDIVTGSASSIQLLTQDQMAAHVKLRTAFFVERGRQPFFKLQPLSPEPAMIGADDPE